MGVFDNFPYTNVHDLNTDWLVKTVKQIKDKTDEIDRAVLSAQQRADQAHADAEHVDIISAQITDLVVTPEMFGAVGDGINDDTVAIQNAVDYALAHNISFVGKGVTYLTTDTIRVIGYRNSDTLEVERGQGFILDLHNSKIHYTGLNFAFSISMLDSSYLNFGYIKAENGGGVLMETYDRWHYISYCIFDGTVFECLNECIKVINQNTGWNNQNKIQNILFKAGSYATHFISNSSNKLNEWIIDRVSLEGVDEGHFLDAQTDSDVTRYITGFAFMYNRAIEHMDDGKHLLVTYGRVVKCFVYGLYGKFTDPNSYSFSYDNSGSTSYTHIAHNIKIITPENTAFIANGKFISNHPVNLPAMPIRPLSGITDVDEFLYGSFYGSVGEFKALTGAPTIDDFISSQHVSTQTIWNTGAFTDQNTNRNAVEEVIMQDGSRVLRGVRNNLQVGEWKRIPAIVSNRRTPLHDTDITYENNSLCILIIANLSGTCFERWAVRYGTTTYTPVKIFSNIGTSWTITNVDTRTYHVANSNFSTSTMIYALIPIGG